MLDYEAHLTLFSAPPLPPPSQKQDMSTILKGSYKQLLIAKSISQIWYY